MKELYFGIALIAAVCCFGHGAKAQILEDDTAAPSATGPILDDTDKSEALFNEMFSDFPETERDVDKSISFGDAVDKTTNAVKKSGVPLSQRPTAVKYPPLKGDMAIGISKGSFKIFSDMSGRTKCSFSVTLKSGLDRELRIMGLRLVFPKQAFAFIFKKVPTNGVQERFITTTGDFCYNLSGIPDIDINICQIRGALDNECAKRIKWDANIAAPARPIE